MDLSTQLSMITKKMGMNFTWKNKSISQKDAFSTKGLLPALTKRADGLSQLCLGYGLGASYQDLKESLLGKEIIFDNFTPSSLRLICILDVLIEIQKMSSSRELVALDELMYD